MINNSRHFIIWAYLEELRLELIAFIDIDGNNLIGQAAFLEHDLDFMPVWRWPRIKINHLSSFSSHFNEITICLPAQAQL